MIIKKGDMVKLIPRKEEYREIRIPMVMIEAILGDETITSVYGDPVILSMDGNMWPLSEFAITWVNGVEIPPGGAFELTNDHT